MSIDSVANEIVQIASILAKPENQDSFGAYVRRKNYLKLSERLSEAEIKKALRQRPELVQHWIQLSEDKRTDSGWYIERLDNGKFAVGYFVDGKRTNEREFSDQFGACATFIVSELEDYRRDS